MTRILVTGSRSWTDVHRMRTIIRDVLDEYSTDITLVHGNARGADRLAAQIAEGWGAKTEAHPAGWDANGKAAGFIRNQAMVDAGADLCLVFLVADAACRGTKDCWRRADRAGIPCRVYESGGAS